MAGDDDLIYHYTSLETLTKIVSSKSMRACNLQYSNDESEASHRREDLAEALEVEADLVRTYREPVPPDPDDPTVEDRPEFWSDLLRGIAADVRRPLWWGPFGICFSKKDDQLSQWRSYGVGGCSIGVVRDRALVTGALVTITPIGNVDDGTYIDHDGFDLTPNFIDMEYGDEGFNRVRDELRAIAHGSSTSASVETQPHFEHLMRTSGQSLAAALKHGGFSEEEEVRLLVEWPPMYYWSDGGPQRFIQHFVRGSLMVPYITVPIDLAAIRRVVIAPGPHQASNVTTVQAFLAGHRLSCSVVPSKTPYRP